MSTILKLCLAILKTGKRRGQLCDAKAKYPPPENPI